MQKALETYRIPADVKKKVSRKKLNRCFRDQDEMPLANDLGSSIEKALRDSEWLILICTPDLLRSSWCLKEVDYFIELGRRDKIIPVLVSGEPSESFPPQIFMRETEYGSEEIEPLAADLRGNMKKQLKTEKLRIVARMLNLNFNDLKKRERERELRRRLIIVSVVLAAALCFGAYAIYKNRVLTQERNASAHNATQLLIEKSVRSSREREMGSGLLYALQAYDNSRIFGDEYNEEIAAALEAAMYPEPFSVIGTLQDKKAYEELEGIRYEITTDTKRRDGQAYPTRLNPRFRKAKRRLKTPFSFLRSYSIWTLILLFLLFSAIGWGWEVSLHLMNGDGFINRGMMHGPWIPIYGSGGIIALCLCSRFRKNPVKEFFFSVALCGAIEYLGAYMLETRYHERWWSYDGNFLNLHGRICAEGLIVFGIACMLVVYLIAPLFDFVISHLKKQVLISVSVALFAIFAVDLAYSSVHPNMVRGAIESHDEDTGNDTAENASSSSTDLAPAA